MSDPIDRRIAQRRPELASALRGLCPGRVDQVADELVGRARSAAEIRPAPLLRRDEERPVATGWHLSPERVGYATHVDRFAGNLDGVAERLDHLAALGVDTVHLLSVLDRGGGAIRQHPSVDPRIGTDEAFDRLVAAMHRRSMSLCVDLAFGRTLGGDGLDLDWSDPDLMIGAFDLVLALANRGVDIVRIDATEFARGRRGTSFGYRPEAHLVAQALRAVMAIAVPSVALLAASSVAPAATAGFLGNHRVERHEFDLGYHDQLMVQGWSMLASQRADMARAAVARLPSVPSGASWLTSVRSDDGIGWAIDDDDAAASGLSGEGHRAYLAEFYRGDFWRSWARGTAFVPSTTPGEERTCGMTATLCGITAAVEAGDPDDLDAGLARFRLLYAIAFGFGGIPMIWMGDEIAQSDDRSWRDDPALATDSRWAHRPAFDVRRVADRDDPDTVAGRAWATLRSLAAARRACPQLQDGPVRISTFDTGSTAVFAWHRHHRRYGDLIGLANVGTGVALVHDHPDLGERPGGPHVIDRLAPDQPDVWRLDPLQVRWLTLDDPLPPVP